MRYYRLEIINPKTGKPPVDCNGKPIGPFDTSKTPGCGLHIEFDVQVTGLDVVNSGTMLAIYGLPLDMLKQSVNLQGCIVRMRGGFSEGLLWPTLSSRGKSSTVKSIWLMLTGLAPTRR